MTADTRLDQVRLLLRNWYRSVCGAKEYQRAGHFLESALSPLMRAYVGWLDYPAGGHRLGVHSGYVTCLVISDDGRWLFTGSGDNSIILWDLTSNKVCRRWNACHGWVRCLALRKQYLVSGGSDDSPRLWDARSNALIRRLEGKHSSSVWAVSFNETGDKIASGSKDHSIVIWSTHSGECLSVWTDYNSHFLSMNTPVKSLSFMDENHVIFLNEQSLCLWDIQQSENNDTSIISDINSNYENDGRSIVLNWDQSILVLIINKYLLFLNVPRMTQLSSIHIEGGSTSFRCACFHPLNANQAAVGCDDGSIKLYHFQSGELIRCLKGHYAIVQAVCFTADGTRLISVGNDKTVRIWDVSTSD